MSQDFTQQNLAYLQVQFPFVYHKINHHLHCKNEVTISEFDFLLNSNAREAYFGSVDLTVKHFICAGLGVGHFLRFLKEKKCSNVQVFIFENNLSILAHMVSRFDLTQLFSMLEIRFVVDLRLEDLKNHLDWLDIFLMESYQIVIEPTLNRFFEGTQFFLSQLSIFLGQRLMDFELSYDQEVSITRNTVLNLPYLINSPGISDFENGLGEDPVLLIAPGPSLDLFIEEIAPYQRYFHVVAVDTAVPVCLQHHCIPDYIVSVDHRDSNLRHFDESKRLLNETVFVCDPGVNHQITKKFPHHVVFYSTQKPLVTWVESLRNKSFGALHPFLSVSYVALQFVLRLTQGPVVFLGLDLCFSQEKMYSKFSKKADSKIMFIEDKPYKLFKDQKIPLREVSTISGETAYTDDVFYQTSRFLDQILKRHSRPFYNLSTGIPLANSRKISIEQLSGLFQSPKKARPVVLKSMASRDSFFDEQIRGTIGKLDRILMKMDQLSDLPSSAQRVQALTVLLDRLSPVNSFLNMMNYAVLFMAVKHNPEINKNDLFLKLVGENAQSLKKWFESLLL